MVIGNLALMLALPAALYSIFVSKKSAHIVTFLVSIASIMLIFGFVNNSFEINYIYEYSSLSLPFLYKLSGIWGGLEGSLLFWAWLLTICVSIVTLLEKGRDIKIVNVFLQAITIFFLITIIFQANPFDPSPVSHTDGRGLNPLLQNFFMLIHPPALYIGYVGFAVPFAYVVAGLFDGTNYFKEIRLWTIVSWLFLTLGNLLGAAWAYIELGWGGFWAWDPVENAGILPWFTACAFLHSIILQERRGMLKMWNVVLIILSFILTIFGTFITRSGIIQSVHSFSDMSLGLYFIVFLAIVILFSIWLLISKRKLFKGQKKLESIFSREGAFCINNVLFVFALFGILWGTMLPLFGEWFFGQKVEVGPPFFNRIMAPLGVLVLFLTGIGPSMSWVKARKGLFKKEFFVPSVLAVIAVVVTYLLGVKLWFPLFVSAGSVFVLTTIVDEFVRSILIESRKDQVGKMAAFLKLFGMAPRRFGGLVIHFGIILLFIGIAGSSYKSEYALNLAKGEKVAVAGYEFTFNSLDWLNSSDSEGVAANVALSKNGKSISNLKPALFLYKNQPKPLAEIDLKVGLLSDVYLALAGISKEDSAEFELTITPLISFVWLGGVVMILGTILAILPARSRRDEESDLDVEMGRATKEELL